ncbi:MAG: hypothetical protein ABJP34_12185 [Erythrobacter sp.]
MPFFKKKPPIRADEYEWLLACFAWLRTVLDDADIRPELITPKHPALLAAKTGPELFEAVRKLAGMEQWDCRLEKVEVSEANPELGLIEGASACGTFSIENGQAVIRYSSAMLRNPDALAATFAHELCHFLLAAAGDPPGGPDLMEHSTDCAAAYLGFGVLLANSARQFDQWSEGGMQGWRASSSGYLSEQSLVTATAMFAALHGHDTADARGLLKPYLQKDFVKADKAIAQDFPDFSRALGEVDLMQWAFE